MFIHHANHCFINSNTPKPNQFVDGVRTDYRFAWVGEKPIDLVYTTPNMGSLRQTRSFNTMMFPVISSPYQSCHWGQGIGRTIRTGSSAWSQNDYNMELYHPHASVFCKYSARSESRFDCNFHCNVRRCPSRTGNVTSKCPLSREAERVIFGYYLNLGVYIL